LKNEGYRTYSIHMIYVFLRNKDLDLKIRSKNFNNSDFISIPFVFYSYLLRFGWQGSLIVLYLFVEIVCCTSDASSLRCTPYSINVLSYLINVLSYLINVLSYSINVLSYSNQCICSMRVLQFETSIIFTSLMQSKAVDSLSVY